MVRTILAAVLVGGLTATPAVASGQDEQPKKKPQPGKGVDSAAKMLSVLHGQRVRYEKELRDTTLADFLADLARRYDLTFVVMEEAFKAEDVPNVLEMKPNLAVAPKIEGLSLHRFLTLVLKNVGAAYLVREDYIEITTRQAAQKEAGLTEAIEEAMNNPDDPGGVIRAQYRLNLPLVCVVVENEPLDAVITNLARAYDLNVVIHPDARKLMKDIRVSERLLNVPADTALEVLAGLADQGVMRKGNTFRVGYGAGQ
jgi:hypothetical protein